MIFYNLEIAFHILITMDTISNKNKGYCSNTGIRSLMQIDADSMAQHG